MSRVIVQLLRAPAGGIRKHVLDIVENLSNETMKQIFITNTHESDVDLTYLKKNRNIEIYHLDIAESPGIRDFVNIIKIYFLLRKKKVDVLHGHGAKGGLYARALSLPLWCKCIYTPHGGSLHRVHGRLKNLIYDLIEWVMLPFTDVYLFESHYSADLFAKNICDPKNKKVVNYNGVEIPENKKQQHYKAHAPIRFASFGLLRHLKGHDIFIETCKMMKDKNIPFSYVIYGHGDFHAHLLDLINRYHLQEQVTIKDYSGDVCQEMQKYDFIVHPSRFESFGYVPVEAMSVNVPVIVSHEGGLREVVDETSGYISHENLPSSYLKIAEKIFNGDDDLSSKISHGLMRTKTLFSKEAMLSKIREIYSDT